MSNFEKEKIPAQNLNNVPKRLTRHENQGILVYHKEYHGEYKLQSPVYALSTHVKNEVQI